MYENKDIKNTLVPIKKIMREIFIIND